MTIKNCQLIIHYNYCFLFYWLVSPKHCSLSLSLSLHENNAFNCRFSILLLLHIYLPLVVCTSCLKLIKAVKMEKKKNVRNINKKKFKKPIKSKPIEQFIYIRTYIKPFRLKIVIAHRLGNWLLMNCSIEVDERECFFFCLSVLPSIRMA